MRARNGEPITQQNLELVPARRVTGHVVSRHFHLSDFRVYQSESSPWSGIVFGRMRYADPIPKGLVRSELFFGGALCEKPI
jgi:hypothetical protein